ncbi:MAG: hypothetical protein WA510_05760 [Acidobacteriaceae bacterium]
MARRLYSLAEWWHLLSLDAPTVAALWSWFFIHAMHLRWSPAQSMLLPVGTWLLYVADRILDGLGETYGAQLRERHHFHARHRAAFLCAAALTGLLLAGGVLTRMNPEAFREDLWIGGLAFVYLVAVHRRGPRFPKELAVAVLFAAATAVPAWSRLGASGTGRERLAPAIVLFALLCWMNCAGIEKWEGGHAHGTTRWASLHLRQIATVTALLCLAAALLAPSRGLAALYLAALVSSGLLFLLDARSSRLKTLHVRIAADVALLSPLALFPLAR